MNLKPGLYIVSTPIGNLDDITIRALDTLKNSNIILCEDTKVSQKLLAKHDISVKLKIYNDHSDANQRRIIAKLIEEGNVISLISDAGTPLISDPGYKLVRELKIQGIHVDIRPGVSAPISALTISGLASDRFLFSGFLPKTTEGKRKAFQDLLQINATLIFFETAIRLDSSLSIAQEVFGNREICVTRELTKLYQESRLGNISNVREFYHKNPPKGEIVLLISGKSEDLDKEILINNLKTELENYLSNGVSAKSATNDLYQRFSGVFSKKEIYKLANLIFNRPSV